MALLTWSHPHIEPVVIVKSGLKMAHLLQSHLREDLGRRCTKWNNDGASYRSLILMQHLVVLGHGDTEDDGCDVLETVDPLLSLRPLASHVEQSERKKKKVENY